MRRPLVLASLLALASASSLGCERREPQPTSRAEDEAPTPPTPSERQEPAAPPLLPEPRDVEIETLDHYLLGATLYASPDPTAPAVVLVHELGATRAQWSGVIEALREAPALTVLAIDLRGHGASTRVGDRTVTYGDFDTEAWARASDDVSAAVEYLHSAAAPLHPSRIAVVGSSIGATAVIRAASEDRTLDVIAALSPGRAYRGVDSILVAMNMGPRAYLGIASREEQDAVETAEALSRLTHGRTEIVDGAAHGLAILAEHEDVTRHLVTFLRESLAAPRALDARVERPEEDEVVPAAAPTTAQ